jgi:hypothetical protein
MPQNSLPTKPLSPRKRAGETGLTPANLLWQPLGKGVLKVLQTVSNYYQTKQEKVRWIVRWVLSRVERELLQSRLFTVIRIQTRLTMARK